MWVTAVTPVSVAGVVLLWLTPSRETAAPLGVEVIEMDPVPVLPPDVVNALIQALVLE